MTVNMEFIKQITAELCYALLGNINKNIKSVSFNCINNEEIIILFVVTKKSEKEEELIEDTIVEFEALHGNLKKLNWHIYLKHENVSVLNNIVYASYNGSSESAM